MSEFSSNRSYDTWITSVRPSTNYERAAQLRVSYGKNVAFSYFGRAFPLGATILSAKLRFTSYEGGTGSGSRTLSLYQVTSRPTYARLTWNNSPSVDLVTTDVKTVTKSGVVPANAVWEFDVTSHLQAVADGGTWSGWRLGLSTTEDLRLYGADSTVESRRPVLEVEWSDAPDAPTQLAPAAGGVVDSAKPSLRWDYTDVSGNTQMAGLQVQVSASESMTSPWDSGEVSATLPQFGLASSSFPGLTAGVPAWWRVRVKDGANLWSAWSDPAEMTYEGRGTFTLLSPSPGGTSASPAAMDDASPVISWNLAGAVQASYLVRVWYGAGDLSKKPLYDSGRIAGTETSITVPTGLLRWDDRRYTVKVYVWDTLDRVATPGSPAYYSETTVAFLDWTEPGATDWTSAEPLDPYPFVELRWGRDPAPDGWVIVRGVEGGSGEIVASLDYADTVQDDGTHLWVDRYAPPRVDLRYNVRPVINGKAALGNVSAPAHCKPVGLWLVNDVDEACLIGVDEGSWAMGENSAIHEPIKGDRVVQIRQGMRGYEGSISGDLMGGVRRMEAVSAADWRDAFLRIKRDGGAWLTAGTVSFPVLLADGVAAPTPDEEERYAASVSFWQSGRFDWEEL